MKRIVIDQSGSWFDIERAQVWDEATHFDGSNWVSTATGSQWRHEYLYRTASGRFVLCRESQYQGEATAYCTLDASEAYAWLSANGHPEDVPQSVLEALGV